MQAVGDTTEAVAKVAKPVAKVGGGLAGGLAGISAGSSLGLLAAPFTGGLSILAGGGLGGILGAKAGSGLAGAATDVVKNTGQAISDAGQSLKN